MIELDQLLTKSEAAEIVASDLKLSPRHVADRVMFMPEFPKPVIVSLSKKRWQYSEIINYLASMRRAA